MAITLLCILGCPLVGTKAYLLFRKHEIRREVKARILAGVDKHELVRLSFSKDQVKNELRWEHAKEFEYGGEMYDIVESEAVGDSIFYWCIHDRAETLINQQMEALTAIAANNDPPSQNSIQQLFDFLKNLFLPTGMAVAIHLPSYQQANHAYDGKMTGHASVPPSPPPEVYFPL